MFINYFYLCLFNRHTTPMTLDMLDNAAPLEKAPAIDFESLSSKYDALLFFYSVRTNNILQALMEKYPDKRSFLEAFIRMSYKDIASLRNCGRKSIEEILAIQTVLSPDHVGQNAEVPDFIPRTLPSNIDTLLPLVMPRLEGLSVRAKNGFIIFLEENHNSLSEVYATVTKPKFNPVKLKNVGRTTAEEFMGLIHGITEYLESFADEQAVEEAVTVFSTRTLDDLQIPAEAQDEIRNLETNLGYFPLFAAIKAYLDGLEEEEKAIFDGCIIAHEDQPLQDRNEVAAIVGLSPERVRQKRNKMIETLSEYFATYRTFGFVDKCPYNYQMRHINEEINAKEGTDFTLHFVNWVLASIFEEISPVGDVLKTLTGYYDKHFFIGLVPNDLCQYMDFEAFIQDIEIRLSEKRIDEVMVSLRNLINSHLKTQYCDDEMPAIETACRSILFLHYPVEVDFGQVIFKPNARKNNPIVAEEIIRAAGHPLTLEEIYEEFLYQYPERYTEMYSFRGSIQSNPNIVPIGRSSTYTLKEWASGENRGGTIREFVSEYLDSLEIPLATVESVGDYVRRFRPDSSDVSISSNLLQERSHRFIILIKDGIRYIGYAEYEYDASFQVLAGHRPVKRTTEESMRLLEEFILSNGHYPYNNEADEEEKRLYRFIGNRRSACARRIIPEEEILEWIAFEEKYREYDIPRFRKRRSKLTIGDIDDVQDNLG